MADDLTVFKLKGWDDVSFHGSDQIMTPNIDVLAYQGAMLQQYYSDTQGTAARSALFTGKYPMRLGTQSDSILASEDRGIPVSERLLPEYLRELGYVTHLVGKWHVGKSREYYLPNYRGFDTFYGFLDGSVDYYTYNLVENCNGTSFFGLNFYENLAPVEDQSGHLTEILTDRAVNLIRNHNTTKPLYLHVSHAAPHTGGGLVSLQPPVNTLAENSHIAHTARRMYAGLVASLDKSVGHIIAALAEREMLKNTIIVFVSDNGAGATENFGCNLPLRGEKSTPWEGAARSVALVWHASVLPYRNDQIFHVTDWLPTLLSAARGDIPKNIDGIDQWGTIVKGEVSKRDSVLITIDDLNGWAAFREGDYKIIVGNVSKEKSKYQGKELKAVRHNSFPYENVLLASEVYLVFKETLNLRLDIESVYEMRNNSKLVEIVNDIPDEAICFPTLAKGCLFNVSEDPTEAFDLWHAKMDIVRRMSLRLRGLWTEMSPRPLLKADPRANPLNQNYVWFSWVPNEEVIDAPRKPVPPFPLQVSRDELQYVVDLSLNSFKDKIQDYIKNMGESFVTSVGGLFNF
ncbi:arylsulfatase B-like [Cydia amplana]|uniref:arylsulfatase B-like n=1 Tax=Cydia amplana TaxID=1869771 RepID=UPI002FE634ED